MTQTPYDPANQQLVNSDQVQLIATTRASMNETAKNKARGEGCVNYVVLSLAVTSPFFTFYAPTQHTSCAHTHTHTHTHTHSTIFNYLEHAERYEMMAEVFKLLQPFYEKQRDFKVGEIPFLSNFILY